MKRSDGDSPISLFSFQDIITSITGIMFLVILLLLLLMLQTSRAAVQRRDTNEITQLQQELKSLRQQLDKIAASDRELEAELRKLNRYTPEELSRMLEELRQKIARLQTVENADQQEYEILKLRLKKLQQQITEGRRQNTRLTEEQQKLTAAIKDIEEKIIQEKKVISQREKVVKYTVSHNTSQEPILIELDQNGARLLHLSSNKSTDFRVAGNGTASILKLQSYLSKQSPIKFYFTIAAKPGGFRYAPNLIAWLKVNGFKRGIEILPDNNTTVFDTGDDL